MTGATNPGNLVSPRLCTSQPLPETSVAGIARGFDAWRGRAGRSASRPKILVALAKTQPWRPWLSEASQLLDQDETERVRSRRDATDRETLTLAYALHRAMLGAVLGVHPREVALHRDERGCPRLAGDAAATSLSHADGAIAVAVAVVRARVGVDIAPSARLDVMQDIASRLCHPEELEAIEGLDEGDRASALLELWVRKEAALKATGVGFAVEPDSFALSANHTVRIQGDSRGCAVRLLAAGSRWKVAVAGPPAADVEYAWTGPRGVLRFYRMNLTSAVDAAAPVGTAERKV